MASNVPISFLFKEDLIWEENKVGCLVICDLFGFHLFSPVTFEERERDVVSWDGGVMSNSQISYRLTCDSTQVG